MSLILKSVVLRWYRSFNTTTKPRSKSQPWEKVGDSDFQFVEIDIDPRITAVVGANESGKSHLLTAISKALCKDDDFTIADICRHCAFNVLDKEATPCVGIRIGLSRHDNATAMNALLSELGLTLGGATELIAILNPKDEKEFAGIYSADGTQLKTVTKQAWGKAVRNHLPVVEFIYPERKFESHIHISQLIASYRSQSKASEDFFDTIPLNQIGRDLRTLKVPAKPKDETTIPYPDELADGVEAAQLALSQIVLQADHATELARDLFEDILEVPVDRLLHIQQLGRKHRGYVELFTADLNERIEQRLDLHSYWTQDEDISLAVDYKDGFFYFEIRDKTQRTFTFEERSSGLRFFLSYYIQSLAIKKRGERESKGSLVLMDEPDRFLSAVAQRNLLQVFEMLSPRKDTHRLQLVYTTHSPFSVNRNFPNRVRLVRKGDGAEGTQLVEASASRCYEPVRSALGIEGAETLFLGMNNIILEGITDQKAIIAAAQLCAADPRRAVLDLNRVAFLRACGVGKVREHIQRTQSGDERRSVVVCLLDGDETGVAKIGEIEDQRLLPKGTFGTYAELGVEIPLHNESETRNAIVLEDFIPISLLIEASRLYLTEAWGKEVSADEIGLLVRPAKVPTMDKILVSALHELEPKTKQRSDSELRGEIVSRVTEELLTQERWKTDSQVFVDRFEKVLRILNRYVQVADKQSRIEAISRQFRLLIEPFIKIHDKSCTAFNVANLLRNLSVCVSGVSSEAKKTRDQLTQLDELLDNETLLGSDPVCERTWRHRLQQLMSCPWKEPENGWAKIRANAKPSDTTS